jgi:hypothetical protein
LIIISVEEAMPQLAVDAVVGDVEVEDQAPRRRVGGNELVDEGLSNLDQGLPVDAVPEATEGRRRGQRRLRFVDLPAATWSAGPARRAWWSLWSS